MAFLNDNYLKLKAGFLFPEIARRVKVFCEANPEAAKRLIRCGIGDVTEPLPAAVIAALHKAAGRRDLAAPLWLQVVDRPNAPAQRAFQELAIYYERHARDFVASIEVIEQALSYAEGRMRLGDERAADWHDSLLLRRSRVHSRLARSTPQR